MTLKLLGHLNASGAMVVEKNVKLSVRRGGWYMRFKLCSIDRSHPYRGAVRAQGRAARGRASRARARPGPSDYVTHTHRTAHKQCDFILLRFFCTVLDYTIFRSSIVYIIYLSCDYILFQTPFWCVV